MGMFGISHILSLHRQTIVLTHAHVITQSDTHIHTHTHIHTVYISAAVTELTKVFSPVSGYKFPQQKLQLRVHL